MSTPAAVLCLVLATLLTTPAAVAFWGQRTLNDTERYVETVRPLVSSSEVQEVIATTVTDAIERQVDLEAIIDDAFADVVSDAPRLRQLTGSLAAAIEVVIEREVRAVVASEEFAVFWERVNAGAQQALQQVLTGERTGAVRVQGDQVVLDVDEVIERAEERLVARGLTFLENVPVPETDRQLVLLEAPQVQQLRTVYAFGNPVARWLLPLVGLLYLAAFALARNRPRVTGAIGAALVVNAVAAALALSIGRQLFVNELSGTAFGPASRVFFDTLLAYLDRGRGAMLWLGVVLVAVGVYAGANRYGRAVRGTVTRGLREVGAGLAEQDAGGSGRWFVANERVLRAVLVIAGFVVLLWGDDVSAERVGWCAALVLALLAVLQVIVGAGAAAGARVTRRS